MSKGMQRWPDHLGMRRGIERHNFLIYRINRRRAEAWSYRGRVVDLGCGKAPYKEIILRTADEYIGVDWKNGMHDHGNVDIFADLSRRLPFADTWADTVVSFQVLEHLPEPGVFLSECYRILQPGGTLLMTVPIMWHVHEAPYDYFRYTRHGLQYLLEKSGFSKITIEEETGFWQMWWLKFNYHTTCFARGPFKYFWYPVWWLTQIVAPWMDKLNRGTGKGQTTHYAIQAKRL